MQNLATSSPPNYALISHQDREYNTSAQEDDKIVRWQRELENQSKKSGWDESFVGHDKPFLINLLFSNLRFGSSGRDKSFVGHDKLSWLDTPLSDPRTFYWTWWNIEAPIQPLPGVREDFIHISPDARYSLLQPIPVRLEPDEDGEWVASFEEANINMSGSDPEDARQALADDIVEAFALFLAEEETLGPGPEKQLAVLRQYLQPKAQ